MKTKSGKSYRAVWVCTCDSHDDLVLLSSAEQAAQKLTSCPACAKNKCEKRCGLRREQRWIDSPAAAKRP